jgi:hypothetical protein
MNLPAQTVPAIAPQTQETEEAGKTRKQYGPMVLTHFGDAAELTQQTSNEVK